MADWQPMTEEQRQRWKDTGLFPVERWGMGQTDATPLVCPLPDRALLRALAEAIPSHIQSSGWYATGQRYEARTARIGGPGRRRPPTCSAGKGGSDGKR